MKKVLLPKHVADIIESVNDNSSKEWILWYMLDQSDTLGIYNWVNKEGNLVNLSQAIEFGYEVEEVPLVLKFFDELKVLMMEYNIYSISDDSDVTFANPFLKIDKEKSTLNVKNIRVDAKVDHDKLKSYVRRNGGIID